MVATRGFRSSLGTVGDGEDGRGGVRRVEGKAEGEDEALVGGDAAAQVELGGWVFRVVTGTPLPISRMQCL